MKDYLATVRVVRHYEIGFESPNFKQAYIDAESIIEFEDFKDDSPGIILIKEDVKIVGVKHDAP